LSFILQGDISYGAEVEFENEALMAVRTANFLSGFLQVVDPKEIFPGRTLQFLSDIDFFSLIYVNIIL
jgi:hypothetical protein